MQNGQCNFSHMTSRFMRSWGFVDMIVGIRDELAHTDSPVLSVHRTSGSRQVGSAVN